MSDFIFLDVDDVIRIHTRELEEFGGIDGLRDRPGLESAVAQPSFRFGRKYLHRDEFEMAAAYAFHIARNHPFIDGNKRTALVACLTFLGMNNLPVFDDKGILFDAMMKIAQGRMQIGELAMILRELMEMML